MEFRMWGYHFDGCYENPDDLRDEQGVYIVWRREGISWTVLEIGQSCNIRQTLAEKAGAGRDGDADTMTLFSALYTPVCSPESRERTLNILNSRAQSLMAV